jgi:hypothetical protein
VGRYSTLREIGDRGCQVTSRPPSDATKSMVTEWRRREGWPSGSVDKDGWGLYGVYKVDVLPTFSPSSFFSSATSTFFIAMAITRRQHLQPVHRRSLRSGGVPPPQPAKWPAVEQPRRNRRKGACHSSLPAHLDHTEGTTRQEVESNRYVSCICQLTIALTLSR